MADPLSIIASVLAIIATAVKVATTVYSIADKMIAAPRELREVGANMNILATILESLAEVLDKGKGLYKEALINTIQSILKRFEAVQKDVMEILGKKQQGVRRRVAWYLKAPKLADSLIRIEGLKSATQLVLSMMNLAIVQTDKDKGKRFRVLVESVIRENRQTVINAQEHQSRNLPHESIDRPRGSSFHSYTGRPSAPHVPNTPTQRKDSEVEVERTISDLGSHTPAHDAVALNVTDGRSDRRPSWKFNSPVHSAYPELQIHNSEHSSGEIHGKHQIRSRSLPRDSHDDSMALLAKKPQDDTATWLYQLVFDPEIQVESALQSNGEVGLNASKNDLVDSPASIHKLGYKNNSSENSPLHAPFKQLQYPIRKFLPPPVVLVERMQEIEISTVIFRLLKQWTVLGPEEIDLIASENRHYMDQKPESASSDASEAESGCPGDEPDSYENKPSPPPNTSREDILLQKLEKLLLDRTEEDKKKTELRFSQLESLLIDERNSRIEKNIAKKKAAQEAAEAAANCAAEAKKKRDEDKLAEIVNLILAQKDEQLKREAALEAMLAAERAEAKSRATKEEAEKQAAIDAATTLVQAAKNAREEAETIAAKEAEKMKVAHENTLAEAKASFEKLDRAKKAAEEETIKMKAEENDKKPAVQFKDVMGRKYSLPWHLCKTWKVMEDLIKQVFLNVDIVGRDVHDGHYDLIGPDEGIILPQFWESVVQPGCTVTMRISTPPPGSNSIPNESIRSSGGEYDTAKYEICFATKYKNFDTQIGEIVASLVDNGFNPTFGMKPSNRSPPKLSGALLWEPSAMRNGSELHESLWQNGWMPVYMRGSRQTWFHGPHPIHTRFLQPNYAPQINQATASSDSFLLIGREWVEEEALRLAGIKYRIVPPCYCAIDPNSTYDDILFIISTSLLLREAGLRRYARKFFVESLSTSELHGLPEPELFSLPSMELVTGILETQVQEKD
ncbi:hypothetical protein GGP41_004396 [Bipolaris sorokiniana]|uniref:Fungal N-terminal domain-containing protein n=1 Tax=Cochliobolus sativus TaxID=45130 RepID=A0A8H6DYU4_COCSA|nr:hypothetical protein GGP41_004396 [Bipolaris sorokiniana]